MAFATAYFTLTMGVEMLVQHGRRRAAASPARVELWRPR
jgi:hypothetical protein